MALNQARAGIARAGNCRANYYTPNLVYLINGVNRSTSMLADSTSVTLALNDEPDTARFVLRPGSSFVPVPGQLVTICQGASPNSEFDGQILRVRKLYARGGGDHVQGGEPDPAIEIECIDTLRLFNRRLVTNEWHSVSATVIARELLESTSGFTGDSIEADLPTIDQFFCINEPPGSAFKRLAVAIGGGFYLDRRDVHLFGEAGESGGRAGTAPRSLIAARTTLKAIAADADCSQIRTRVIVEGAHATCPISIFAATEFPIDYSGGQLNSLPLVNADRIDGATTIRMRHVIFATTVTVADGTEAPAAVTTVSTAAAKGDTTLTIGTTTGFPTRGWVKVGDEFVYYDALGGAGLLVSIPPDGELGSIRAPIAVGVEVTPVSQMTVDGGTVFDVGVESGAEVFLRVTDDDAVAQGVLAAIEGGDGIHEHPISDGRLSVAGATARAARELEAFAADLTTIVWDTDDMNAKPGRSQVVTYGDVSMTVPITSVELSWPSPNRPARRSCEASNVRMAEVLDAVVTSRE